MSATTTWQPGWRSSSPISTGFRCLHPATIAPVSDLSHVDETGDVRMVDVGGKPLSRRRAVAVATVRMAPETARRLRELSFLN